MLKLVLNKCLISAMPYLLSYFTLSKFKGHPLKKCKNTFLADFSISLCNMDNVMSTIIQTEFLSFCVNTPNGVEVKQM